MAVTQTRTIRLSNDLMDAATLRAEALGYADPNTYIKSLVRYDLMVQGDHPLTVAFSKLPPHEQDKLDAHLLTLTNRGKGERGQLLTHVLERLGLNGDDILTALSKKV